MSKNNNKQNQKAKDNHREEGYTPTAKTSGTKLTPEQKAQIVRDRLANRPVIVFRYPNGKLNKRFVFTLALFIVALIVALYFISRV